MEKATFIARDERQRLCVALAELVDELGYDHVEGHAVARRARLPADAFDRWFDSKEECVAVAFEAMVDQAFEACTAAYVESHGSWPDAVRATLACLLDFLAGAPALTRLCAVHALDPQPPGLERRDRMLDCSMEFLLPGHAVGADGPPEIVSEAIVGGVYELLRSRIVEDRVESLPKALPDATVIALAPFVGGDVAARMADRRALG